MTDDCRRPAWAEFKGYYGACIHAARCRNELVLVMEAMRAKKLYEFSDALRGIVERLDRGVSYPEPDLSSGRFRAVSAEFSETFRK